MELLNNEMAPAVKRDVKIVQFGQGNFIRAFVDYMVDIANEKGLFDGSIVMVKPTARGNLDRFKAQDCRYTVQLRGRVDGEEYVETRLITSVSDIVSPYIDYEEYIGLASLDSVRFVISNTTEAGIVFNSKDAFEDKLNVTFPAKLTQFLYARYQTFNGASDKGLIMLPLELIDDNGAVLQKCVLQYIDLWQLPEGFKSWVEDDCIFASTLVDRIVTGYPKDEAEAIWESLGYQDNILDTAEPFALWVIEAGEEVAKEFPLDKAMEDKAGMDVLFTDNQKPYKQRKVRILNGAHTSFVLASYLKGNDYVNQSMKDELIRNFMDKTLHDEVIPTLTLPKEDLEDFATAVVDRFNNPFIQHSLLAIALNSVSKYRARCLPSLLDYVAKFGTCPTHLTMGLAALMAFYSSTELQGDTLIGHRGEDTYEIKDDMAVLEFFAENSTLPTREIVENFLAREDFHGQNLNEVAGLTDLVTEYLDAIRTSGMQAALEKYFG